MWHSLKVNFYPITLHNLLLSETTQIRTLAYNSPLSLTPKVWGTLNYRKDCHSKTETVSKDNLCWSFIDTSRASTCHVQVTRSEMMTVHCNSIGNQEHLSIFVMHKTVRYKTSWNYRKAPKQLTSSHQTNFHNTVWIFAYVKHAVWLVIFSAASLTTGNSGGKYDSQ